MTTRDQLWSAEINLTDLPDELLDKIFSHLTFFNRLNARAVDKKMVAFQARNYPHIFDRVRAGFNTLIEPHIAELMDKASKHPLYIQKSIFNNKTLVANYGRRELSKRYVYKILQFINMTWVWEYLTQYDTTNYAKLMRLVAELIYCRIMPFRSEINTITCEFIKDAYKVATIEDVFRKLILILMIIDTDYEYYHIGYRFGLILEHNHIMKLKDRYPSINKIYIDLRSPRDYNSVTTVMYIHYMQFNKFVLCGGKGFIPLDTIQYIEPSVLNRVNSNQMCNQIFNYILPKICKMRKVNGNSLGTTKRISYRGIMDLIIAQLKRTKEEVYAQAIADDKRCYVHNGYWCLGPATPAEDSTTMITRD